MSATIKFTVSDENYKELIERAKSYATMQDYIRSVLFPDQVSKITPEKAVHKAIAKYKKGELFTVPEIYGSEWDLENGYAGVFGRQFYNLVSTQYTDVIEFTESYTKNGVAVYQKIK